VIEWSEIEEGIDEGVVEVPLDYDDPSAGTTALYLVRHRATNSDARIGSMLINPGGPGVPGSEYGYYAAQLFSTSIVERFDIIGWDPRGTGSSSPAIDCIDDYDRYYASSDITPDDEAERQQIVDLAEELQSGCVQRTGDAIQYVGTNNSARDIDAIRRALGEDQITYFGFSYGSELGAVWATLFPDTVRAAVLDGAIDPTAGMVEASLQQSKGFEQSLATFLARCSADSSCEFHNGGNAEAAFDALMLELDESPAPTEAGRPPLNRQAALNGVGQAMYSDQLWPELEQALALAQGGDGRGMLALHDSYFQRDSDGTWPNMIEAFQTISCMDEATRFTVAEEDAQVAQFNEAAPRFAPGTTGSYFCTFYPESSDPRIAITGAGAGPIVVIGVTGDSATPLEGTRKMADELDEGVLLVVDAEQHTGYGVNGCTFDVIDRYLIDLEPPAPGTEC
jgi:pimeloyl-ACP methyl ester carboxylesterase